MYCFLASSCLVPIGNTTFNWKLTLSQDECSIFQHPFQDPDMRFESPTFHVDLNWEGKTTRLMLSLVIGPALFDRGYHTSTSCCKCFYHHSSGTSPGTGPALFIRNLSEENIDMAKISVERQVIHKVHLVLTIF